VSTTRSAVSRIGACREKLGESQSKPTEKLVLLVEAKLAYWRGRGVEGLEPGQLRNARKDTRPYDEGPYLTTVRVRPAEKLRELDILDEI